jgi:acyl transferase domain-containing protein
MLFFSDTDELEKKISNDDITLEPVKIDGKIVFLFPGNGIYQLNMLDILKNSHPYMKDIINEYEKLCPPGLLESNDYQSKQLQICISEIAIAKLWIFCGITPEYMIGHSLGEYAAAVVGGIIAPKDLINMLIARGDILQDTLNDYSMMSVQATYDKIERFLDDEVKIAAYNNSELFTITGASEKMDKLKDVFKENGISATKLQFSGGGHNDKLKSSAERFMNEIRDVKFNKPFINIIPTAMENQTSDIMSDAAYWLENLVSPVKFMQAFNVLKGQKIRSMVDIGVSPVLLSMAMMNFRDMDTKWIPSIKSGRNYRSQLLKAAGQLFISGENIKWNNLYMKEEV